MEIQQRDRENMGKIGEVEWGGVWGVGWESWVEDV